MGVLHTLKGVGNRAFYRGLSRDYHPLFPQLPERTRLFRSFVTHLWWTGRFLAQPTLLGVIDRYGIELIHPIREGRSPRQIGCKGLSNHRWIVSYKLCLWVNHLGGLVGWLRAPAPVHDFADCFFWILVTPNIQSKRPRALFCTGSKFTKKSGYPSYSLFTELPQLAGHILAFIHECRAIHRAFHLIAFKTFILAFAKLSG